MRLTLKRQKKQKHWTNSQKAEELGVSDEETLTKMDRCLQQTVDSMGAYLRVHRWVRYKL